MFKHDKDQMSLMHSLDVACQRVVLIIIHNYLVIPHLGVSKSSKMYLF